jgi:hypothetical protein
MPMLEETWAWLAALPPDLAFLFTLPFLVGALGLAGEWWRRRRYRTGSRATRVATDKRRLRGSV